MLFQTDAADDEVRHGVVDTVSQSHTKASKTKADTDEQQKTSESGNFFRKWTIFATHWTLFDCESHRGYL